MTVGFIIALTLWAVAVTCLYAGEYARRRNAEEKIELEVLRASTSVSVANEHDVFLRSLIERGYDLQRETMTKLLEGPEIAPPEQLGLEDQRIDIPPEMTADWTDFDPSLWEPQGPSVIGEVPAGFPVPDVEDFSG